MRLFLLPLLVVAIIAISISTATAAEKKFGARERAVIEGKFRNKDVATRLKAVQMLVEYDQPETAEVLIKDGLHDPEEEVRRAAYDALLESRNTPSVCDYLIDRLNQESRRRQHDPVAPLFLATLLSSELGDVQTSSRKFVNEKLAATRDGGVFIIALADLLAIHHAPIDIGPLVRLLHSKVSEPFGVRRALIGALTQIDDAGAVSSLVSELSKIDGEARADAIEYLALVTKQQFVEPAAWQEWWAKQRDTFTFPKDFKRPPLRTIENLVSGGSATYYGLPLYARRLVFVVDISGSMDGPRIMAAKQELTSAISALKPQVSFNIVIYHHEATPWEDELVPADDLHKAQALQFIADIHADGGTATYDGLELAFQYDAEAIYLLTDGAPTSGKFRLPLDIVNAISTANRTRRESIYTIGIGPGPVDSPFEAFLKLLAARNFGLYRRVDE
jgi:hypothetical protein